MTINEIHFWQNNSIYLVNPYNMKAFENFVTRLITVLSASPTNELMPKLIPVRVITNRIPRKKDH